MVTGIRQDPAAEANRIVVEQDKRDEDKGLYLSPDAYGMPPEKGVDWRNTDEGREAYKAQLAAQASSE